MKKPLKFIAGLLAVLLIAGVCYSANSFLGNPVSYLLANWAAEKYIETEFTDTDYEVERVAYSFKTGDYYAYLTSPTNIDGDFTLTIDYKGKVENDDYAWRVEERYNTESRLQGEYYTLVKEGLSDNFSYNVSAEFTFKFSEGLEKHEEAILQKELELNKEYDIKELARKQGHILLWTKVDDPSVETLAEILLEVKRVADTNGVPFYSLEVSLFEIGENVSSLDVMQFLYDDIYEDGLVERIEREVEETQAYYEQKNQEKQEELGG